MNEDQFTIEENDDGYFILMRNGKKQFCAYRGEYSELADDEISVFKKFSTCNSSCPHFRIVVKQGVAKQIILTCSGNAYRCDL